MERLNVLLTGPAGRIGPSLVEPFAQRYNLRCFDRRPFEGHDDVVTGDLTDYHTLKAAMDGVEVVVHLAATADEAPFIEQLVPNNVIGLYNVLQAAQESRVRRVVFASSCQTVTQYPPEHTVEIDDPVRPSTRYGATKVFGEALGRFYHEKFGLEFIGIRIGWFAPYDHKGLMKHPGCRRLWLSPKDAARLFELAIEKPGIGYALVFGTSITDGQWLSRKPAREQLGFEPRDDVARLYPLEPQESP
jgi:uronate dehydrogenase